MSGKEDLEKSTAPNKSPFKGTINISATKKLIISAYFC